MALVNDLHSARNDRAARAQREMIEPPALEIWVKPDVPVEEGLKRPPEWKMIDLD